MKKIFLALIILLFASLCFAEDFLYENNRLNSTLFPSIAEYITLEKDEKSNDYLLSTVTYRMNSNTTRIFRIYCKDVEPLKNFVFKLESDTDNTYDNHICDIVNENKAKFTQISESTDFDEVRGKNVVLKYCDLKYYK